MLHYTAMQSARAAADWLCNPKAEVSAHYLIARDGEVLSLVPEALRAWHAGAGRWGSVCDINSRSIGIEIDNPGDCAFTPAQYTALNQLLDGIRQRWQIRPERVIGHSDMAPGRKIDPGPHFDWRAIAQAGHAVWPNEASERAAAGVDHFIPLARSFGYTADVPDRTLLDAFRLRFRPGASGPVDAADMRLITDLAARFPVDVNAVDV